MGLTGNELVRVLRTEGDDITATVKLKHIDGFYWSNIVNTGRESCTEGYNLHGFIYSNKIEVGELGYFCVCGCYPHIIEVYIPEDLNKEVFAHMAQLAGEKPEGPKEEKVVGRAVDLEEDMTVRPAISIPATGSTSAIIREIVEQYPGITAKELEDLLVNEGIKKRTIRNSINYLRTNDFKTLPKLRTEPYKETQRLYLDYSSCG